MATRTISNAGGAYNSTASWVEGVVPVAGDDIVATPTSGMLTSLSGSYKSIDLVGYGSKVGSFTTTNIILTGLSANGYSLYIPDNITMTINGNLTCGSNLKVRMNATSGSWHNAAYTCYVSGYTLTIENYANFGVIDFRGTVTLLNGAMLKTQWLYITGNNTFNLGNGTLYFKTNNTSYLALFYDPGYSSTFNGGTGTVIIDSIDGTTQNFTSRLAASWTFTKLVVFGTKITFNANSYTIGTLELNGTCYFRMLAGKTANITSLKTINTVGQSATLASTTAVAATMAFGTNLINGVDRLNISYMNATGSSGHYAGANSTIANSTGWTAGNDPSLSPKGNGLMFGVAF